MVQRGGELRLLGEAEQAISFLGGVGWQNLDGDVALQLDVPREVDLAHAARADELAQLVPSETGPAW